MSENPPADGPAQVFHRTRELALAGDFAGFVDLFAEHGTLEFPFQPLRIEGRARIHEFIVASGRHRLIRFTGFPDLVLHTTSDTVVAEFDAVGTVTGTGAPFHRRYVHVLRVTDGRIVSYRDYSAPLPVTDPKGDNGQ